MGADNPGLIGQCVHHKHPHWCIYCLWKRVEELGIENTYLRRGNLALAERVRVLAEKGRRSERG